MLKRIFFVLMSFQLCGCAFIGLNPKHADYTKTNHINNTCSFKPNSLKTKSELLKWWGEPNKKELFDNGTKEKFTYYGSWVWSGVTIWLVVIPIPLILPTKSEYCVVNLENQLIKNTEEYNQVESQFYGCAAGYDYTVKGKWEYGCGLPVVY